MSFERSAPGPGDAKVSPSLKRSWIDVLVELGPPYFTEPRGTEHYPLSRNSAERNARTQAHYYVSCWVWERDSTLRMRLKCARKSVAHVEGRCGCRRCQYNTSFLHPLSITEVVNLLQNPPEDGMSTIPPARPQAGAVFLYTHGDDTSKKGTFHQ